MRYTKYRGAIKDRMELTILFTCMNLKKLAVWKFRKGFIRNYFNAVSKEYIANFIKIQKDSKTASGFRTLLSTI
jgi:hypothetical protein